MNKLIIGTRSSNLALTQTKFVIKKLKEIDPTIDFVIKKIKTKGDILLDKDLNNILDKGFFVSEIQNELINKSIDFAVHSLKDLPTDTNKDLISFTVTERENPMDVLVLSKSSEKKDLKELKIIGTSSLRRKQQLQSISDKISIKSIRGNIETRIQKLDQGQYDGIILAAAGLNRLGLQNRISRFFNLSEITPSAGQGALAVECRTNDAKTISILKKIQHKQTEICVNEERKFLNTVGGGCSSPDAVLCVFNDEEIEIRGRIFNKQTNEYVEQRIIDKYKNHNNIGIKLAKSMMLKIKDNIIRNIILTNEGDVSGFNKLKENNLITHHFPMIKIKPLEFILDSSENYDFIIFTSKNGVRNFINKTEIKHKTKFICLGKKTELALNELGYKSYYTAKKNYSKIMADELKKNNLIKNSKTLLVQGKIAKNALLNGLQEICDVKRLNVYNTVPKKEIYKDLEKLLNTPTMTVFSSPSSFDSFKKFYNPKKTNIISIGNTTTEHIISKGYKCITTSKMQSFEGVSESILKYLNKL